MRNKRLVSLVVALGLLVIGTSVSTHAQAFGSNVQTQGCQNVNTANNAATSMSCVLASAVASGDLIACRAWWASSLQTTSITDSLGNNYTALPYQQPNSNFRTQVFYLLSSVAGSSDTVTIHFNNAVALGIACHVYRGATFVLDTYNQNVATAKTVGTGPTIVTLSGDLVIGSCGTSNGATGWAATGTGVNLRETNSRLGLEDNLLSGTSFAAGFTWTGSNDVGCTSLAFTQATPPPPPPPPLPQVAGAGTITGGTFTPQVIPTIPGDIVLASLTLNNTAGCAGKPLLPSYCTSAFVPLNTKSTNLVGVSGNPGAQTPITTPTPVNISCVDFHTIVPPGVLVLAHFMPWFVSPKSGDHSQTKYNSNDVATVNAQMNQMINCHHLDGLVIDWYSQLQTNHDQTAQKVRDNLAGRCSAPQLCKMEFSIAEDQGAVFRYHKCANDGTVASHNCIKTAWETDLCYMNQTFFGSNAYMKVDPVTKLYSSTGKLVVYTFPPPNGMSTPNGWDPADLLAVHNYAQNLSGNCPTIGHGINNGGVLIVDENSGAFTESGSDGAYAFISPVSTGWDTTYTGCKTNPNNATQNGTQFCIFGLDGTYYSHFYAVGNNNPAKITSGSANPGFDDNNAATWGSNRVKARECGQTFNKIKQQAFTSTTITFMILNTWNDVEEGSAVENGIDNCYGVTSSLASGHILNWAYTTTDPTYAPTSPTNGTIDHITIYYGIPGSTFVAVAIDNLTPATVSYDLATITQIPTGTWDVYVYGTGTPFMRNFISTKLTYVK